MGSGLSGSRRAICRRIRLRSELGIDIGGEVYKRLPLDEGLSANVILAAVLKTEPDTRHRKQTCQKLQKLADFAGLEAAG